MSHAIERMRQEYRSRPWWGATLSGVAAKSETANMAEAEPEKPLPADVPLCERGFGVMDADGS